MTWFELLSSAFIIFMIYIACSCLWHERKARIPPVPVMPWVKRRAIKLALQHSSHDQPCNIVDLGSGWGGVTTALARSYKRAQVRGYELSPWPYRFSKLRTALSPRISISKQDFFKADISDADLIYCYLHPDLMRDLIPQFKTMKSGALIISCSFSIPDWQPIATTQSRGIIKLPIYIYQR